MIVKDYILYYHIIFIYVYNCKFNFKIQYAIFTPNIQLNIVITSLKFQEKYHVYLKFRTYTRSYTKYICNKHNLKKKYNFLCTGDID